MTDTPSLSRGQSSFFGALLGRVLREGELALGPVAALEEPVGVQLVRALAEREPSPVRIDAPGGRRLLRDWAVRAGLVEQASVPLMTLGGRPLPGRRERILAVASRGLG